MLVNSNSAAALKSQSFLRMLLLFLFLLYFNALFTKFILFGTYCKAAHEICCLAEKRSDLSCSTRPLI